MNNFTIDFSDTYQHFPNRVTVRYARKIAEGDWGDSFDVENVLSHAVTKEVLEGGRRLVREYCVFHIWKNQFSADHDPKIGDRATDPDGVTWMIVEPVLKAMEGARFRCTCERAK